MIGAVSRFLCCSTSPPSRAVCPPTTTQAVHHPPTEQQQQQQQQEAVKMAQPAPPAPALLNVTILDDYFDTLRTLPCFAKLEGHNVTVRAPPPPSRPCCKVLGVFSSLRSVGGMRGPWLPHLFNFLVCGHVKICLQIVRNYDAISSIASLLFALTNQGPVTNHLP